MHTDAAARRPARLSIGASHPAIMLIGQWPVGSHAPGTAKTLVGVHDTLLGTHRQAMPRIAHVQSIDGVRVGYRTTGTGPPLVLVHGASADSTVITLLIPLL